LVKINAKNAIIGVTTAVGDTGNDEYF